jgi:hypothetical protein
LTDITDSAIAAGANLPGLPSAGWDAYAEDDTMALLRAAIATVTIINHANRSMGLDDAYPFVVTPAAQEKLAFVHHWLRRGAQGL